MNRIHALSLVFLLCTTASNAQTSGKHPSYSLTFSPMMPLPSDCPVEVKARLDIPAKVVLIKGEQPQGITEKLQITLNNPKSPGIAAAHMTIRGVPVGVRFVPAVVYLPDDPAQISKTVAFDRPVAAGQNASIFVGVSDFSAVTSIDLDSVTFADGLSWHPIVRRACSATGRLSLNSQVNVAPR
jgi:hypothetical protein